jgi:alpha-L-rhamnosidase
MALLPGRVTPVTNPRPRLGWIIQTDQPDWRQTRAELSWVSLGQEQRARVESDQSVQVAWPFTSLTPRQSGEVRVRVEGLDGWTEWSQPLAVAASFLDQGEWAGQFIALPAPSRQAQPVLLRRVFRVGSGLRRATLYATAQGVYQVEVNGRPSDDHLLKPGWTSYQYRLTHETSDITASLRIGDNVIGVLLAGGWFCQQFGFHGRAVSFYGAQPAFAGQVLLEYADGRQEWLLTDDGWRAWGDGPILQASNYGGEHYDARREPAGWSSPGFDDAAWEPVALRPTSLTPQAQITPPIRVTQTVPVAEVLRSASGATILDFGQNLVGHLRLSVRGPAGTTVRLRHAEVLENGELGTRPLRAAAATDEYTLSGHGPEDWAPRFTFHGFRFVEVTGWPGELDPASIVAQVVGSDMVRTGWFDCSDPELSRLHENVVWSMRGNFLSIPTDCPQRDERLGWTGDIQVFGPTASYLFDCDGFLASWLTDLALEQRHQGGLPFVVPDVLDSAHTPVTGWGDVAVLLPWTLYQRFGDRQVLVDQYDSAKAWVDQVLALAGERHLWEGDFQFGDWVDPDAPPDQAAKSKVDPDLVASAYLYHSCRVLAQIANLLEQADDANHYRDQAALVRQAWQHEYVTPAGRLVSDAQTGYALAIEFGLVDQSNRQVMGDRLAWLCRRDGYRIGTGFLGTPLLCDALTHTGHEREAGRMLRQHRLPSWLYPVTMGATTIWERWDSLLEDGSINPGEMTSFNHYALGAIADWMQRVVAGLGPLEPGYRRLRIAPQPIAGLDWARTSHLTPYGLATAGWRDADGQLIVEASVPANTSATVALPDGRTFTVGSGDHHWRVDPRPVDPAPVVSFDTSMAALIDDEAAFSQFLTSFMAADEAEARAFLHRASWVPGLSLGHELEQSPMGVVDRIEADLAELTRARAAVERH